MNEGKLSEQVEALKAQVAVLQALVLELQRRPLMTAPPVFIPHQPYCPTYPPFVITCDSTTDTWRAS